MSARRTSFVVDSDGRPIIDKDTNARKLYGLDLTAELGDDTLDSASVAAEADVEAETPTVATTHDGKTGKYVLVWVSGGTAGILGSVTLRYVTAGGTIDDVTLYFQSDNW